MGHSIPGGCTLDSDGRPTDAEGGRLSPLPDTLSEEEKERCFEAGLVCNEQVEYYSAGAIEVKFGIDRPLAEKAKGEANLFSENASGQEGSHPTPEEAQQAAEELGAHDPLEGVEFGSTAAEELAVEHGDVISAEDFEEVEPSGKTGYTKPDVEAVIEAVSE